MKQITSEFEAVQQVDEILENLNDLGYNEYSSAFDLLSLAVKIQENIVRSRYNDLYAMANVVIDGTTVPSALEKIATELAEFNKINK